MDIIDFFIEYFFLWFTKSKFYFIELKINFNFIYYLSSPHSKNFCIQKCSVITLGSGNFLKIFPTNWKKHTTHVKRGKKFYEILKIKIRNFWALNTSQAGKVAWERGGEWCRSINPPSLSHPWYQTTVLRRVAAWQQSRFCLNLK